MRRQQLLADARTEGARVGTRQLCLVPAAIVGVHARCITVINLRQMTQKPGSCGRRDRDRALPSAVVAREVPLSFTAVAD